MPISKLGQRRQVVIPKEIRDELGLREGDFVEVTSTEGHVIIKPKKLVDADDVLMPEEEKIVRTGEAQLKKGEHVAWDDVKKQLNLSNRMATPWTIRLSPEATRQLSALPRDHQVTIGRAIDRMRQDPSKGMSNPLKGKRWQGRYRKRVGRYRLIFIPFHQQYIVEISAILLRTEGTYR